ncbi:MAG: hypothetical protein DLM72_14630 [Candidatus Nitrosopolaris wilkensis]|nr:MAG: hypothetical protein DLM72_14630 [Candidatus Nitrosopolaris wilkensis]
MEEEKGIANFYKVEERKGDSIYIHTETFQFYSSTSSPSDSFYASSPNSRVSSLISSLSVSLLFYFMCIIIRPNTSYTVDCVEYK